MNYKVIILVIITLILSTRNTRAGDLNIGAAPTALGKAYTTIAEGPLAVYWNPANLADENRIQLGYSYKDIFNDEMFYGSYIGLILPVYKNNFTGGIALYHVDTDPGKNYSYSENTLLAGNGMRINKYLLLGISGKIFYSTFSEYKYGAADINAAATVKISIVRVAVAGVFESTVKQEWTRDSKGHFNRGFRAGCEIPISNLSGLFEAEYVLEKVYSRAGIIYHVAKMLKIMGGIEFDPIKPASNMSSSMGVEVLLFNNLKTGFGISNGLVYDNYVLSMSVIF